MSDRRTTVRFIRRAILAASLSCAVGSVSFAVDPSPSREYPATYSSRKAPWYDPFRVFTSPPKAAEPKPAPVPVENASIPAPTPAPTFRQPSRPAEVPTPAPVLRQPSRPADVPVFVTPDSPALGSAPAWKWYGYGTPSHNGFANAPSFSAALPHVTPPTSVVTIPSETPKIGPVASSLVREEAPVVVVPPSDGPKLPGIVASPSSTVPSDVNWKSSPGASLKLPTSEAPSMKIDGPGASLRKPVPLEEKPPATPTEYTAPLSQNLTPGEASKEITVVPAPGIAVPK